jgi:uncharacterized membrane protein
MKHHVPNLQIGETAHKLHEEEKRWVVRHAALIALIFAGLIVAGIVYLLSNISYYSETGVWPLWG